VSELLPSAQAREISDGLLDFLTTTFALADPDARLALTDFLSDREYGIFKGPYLRLRLPFRAAADGWQSILGWNIGLTPYGHQAAAFTRLSSADLGPDRPRPLPTLVTTGTGSGKTEAFLYPILDHVLRARRAGVSGMKALILYPMNALANDQAKRLADLLTTREELAGITAALYTGQEGPQRTRVSADGLITDRAIIRDEAPDILLTNYKMLDQLLLRYDDRNIWKQSVASLQYLVLDEFHTYDGAQGTDVAMLLRRLGLTLKSHLADDALSDEERARPLGRVTPVATSATLGDQGDPAAMMGFASTVFGDDFGPGSVITESRLDLDEWTVGAAERVAALGLTPRVLARADLAGANSIIGSWPRDSAIERTMAVISSLYHVSVADAAALGEVLSRDSDALLALIQTHPLVHDLVRSSEQARHLGELAESLFPEPASGPATGDEDDRLTFLTHLTAALSHVRVLVGRAALGVDLHLWVRELTRIDRVASAAPRYRWSDDGELTDPGDVAVEQHAFPAIYCRHCGRSGWGVGLAPVGSNLDTDDSVIRRNHAAREGRFRAVIYAPLEAEHAPGRAGGEQADGSRPDGRTDKGDAADVAVEGLRWLSIRQRMLLTSAPDDDDADNRDGWVLPVLTQVGPDADDESRDDTCPSCQQKDGIRFLGSAIATLLSVTLSTLFGDQALDPREKKALVFTDSVQDAAHRAGFVESRSHTLTLRALLRHAVGDHPVGLDSLVDQAIAAAGDDPFRRYRIIPPDLVERDEFAPFWQRPLAREIPARVRTRVRRRLLFDAVLEFGLQSRVGRTLEQTGSAVAEVDAGQPSALASYARAVLSATDIQDTLDGELAALRDESLVAWVRGVLEHMRVEGAVEHEWLQEFIRHDGNRYFIWGGRPRGQGMPVFPRGRSAPAFPRIGPAAQVKDPLLVTVTSPQSWYARWTARTLNVTAAHGARLARQLLERLARADVLHTVATESGGTVFAVPASSVLVSPTDPAEMLAGRNLLTCTVCRAQQSGTATVVAQLDDAPCMLVRCPGRLRRESRPDNYYRRLYVSADMRRIVAREHTGLIDDATRLEYERQFKQSTSEPNAPNVLVATPTLEMGIDIGDLSAVLLASLPKTVASYLQRVGRAGRLTGSALNLAFITGRGEQLPRLEDPLSVINGEVRAPATYLSAEEILRRQYVAHLVDCFARADDRPHPRLARAALGSADAGSFIGELIRFAEDGAEGHLDRFLGSFQDLAESPVESLRGWATPADGEPDSSGLAAHLFDASQRWVAAVEGLVHRRAAIELVLPELMRIADSPAASDDDRRALRSARAALAMTRKESQRLTGEYWIGVLEEFGILPNYTLLDDMVALDVSVTWIDPETQEFQSEQSSIARSSANALREFAPGATFYAMSLEILIDAVDLGPDDSAIRSMAFCPNCGFALDLSAPGSTAPSACPRCGGAGFSGTEHRLDVVELTRVSAQLRRDEAVISDRSDERKRERYTIAAAADVDPAFVAKRWYVNDYDFGTKYLRRMVIRWVNIGRAGAHGAGRQIAGTVESAPLFRVCEGCGVLDKNAAANRPEDHRAWCRYRKATDKHVRSIALARTLTTQGAVIRLPQSVTVGDQFAIPSLAAALLLGLHEQIGGSPDHINIGAISEPVADRDGATSAALLLHDVVPGGTGYLAELADPARMWDLLHRAWVRVRDCPCQQEQRLACHRCLIPFAAAGNLSRVSRLAAERHLRSILTSGTPDAEPADSMSWSLTTHEPALPSPESHLEQSFRKVFTERVTALGATVKETPGPQGNRLGITFPGTTRQWTLDPQVPMGSSRPDFVLRSNQGSLPTVVIFTDGWAYHASPARNRLADDAHKRQELRDGGAVVLAITARDVEHARNGTFETPTWLNGDVIAALMSSTVTFRPHNVETIGRGPIEFLLSWIQSPDVEGHRVLANRLPFLFVQTAEQLSIDPTVDLADEAALRLYDPGRVIPAGEAPSTAWWWSAGGVGCLTRASGDDITVALVETALVIDDRAESLADREPSADAWREWLRVSNALNLREQPTMITTTTAEGTGAVGDQAKHATVRHDSVAFDGLGGAALSPSWQAVRDLTISGAERLFVEELARLDARAAAEAIPTPVVGHEADGGIPVDFAWPDARIAVFLDLETLDADDRRVLELNRWRVLTNDPVAILAALKEAA
jgi:ATP-dependent helicase YprA (DUF1998 family)